MHRGHRVIDIHCHLAPLRLARAVRQALHELHGWTIDGPIDPDDVLDVIHATGIDVCVHLPYAHRPGIAASLNEHGVAFAAAHSGVLTFATVHPDDEQPEAILEAAMDAGACGLKVHCPVQRVLPDDPRLARILAWCERSDVPVLVHATATPEEETPYTGLRHLEVALDRHPDLRVCLAHLGSPEVGEAIALLERHDNLVVDVAGLPSPRLAADPRVVEALHAHPDRMLFASDYPNVIHRPQDALEAIFASGLDDAGLRAVLHGNALRFLKLAAMPTECPDTTA